MSNVQVNSTVLPSELAQILESNQVQIGSQISYQLCKLLWEYHPLAGKIIEKPVRLALSKPRKITINCGIEDQLKEAFEREWDKLGATNHIRDTMYLSRVYGAAAIIYGAPEVPTDQPIDPWQLADLQDLYFNQLDPLNLAGSIITNQNPNSPDFQKPNQSITAAGQPYHHSRSCTVFCGTPIYLAFQGSSFSFSGRSLFLRALYPLKSFIQTMTVDDLVSLKSGLLVAKIEQSGSIVNRLMQSAAGGKRELLREAQTGNVLSISPDESIESIDMNNTDKAMTTARNNIIANIAAACDVPAILLKDEAFTQGFGEGTEDAKAVAQYIEGLRHDMHDLFEYFDKIVQYRAWNRDFYESLVNEHPEEMGGMTYEQFFYFAQNQFRATFPTLYEEPESEKIRRDSDKLKAMSDVLKTLGEMVDPENKARVVEWFTDNINGMTELFTSPITLDIEALAQYEPPQPEMGGFGGQGGDEPPTDEQPQEQPPQPKPPQPKKGVEGRTDADWQESKHPRDESGKFTSGGGGGGSSSEPTATEQPKKQYNRKERQPHEPKKAESVAAVSQQLTERENDLQSINIPQAAGSSITPDQTRQTLGNKYKEAAALKPKYDDLMSSIAAELGVEDKIMLAPLKGVKRAVEKISGDYQGDANKIKDLVRGTIVVDNFEQTLKAIEMIGQRMGKPIGLRNGLVENSEAESPDGYRDIKMNIDIDGHVTEVQVNFKEMIEAKDGEGHKLYEAARAIESNASKEGRKLTQAEKLEVERLFVEQKNLYDSAWDKIQARAGGGKSTAKKADGVSAVNDDEHWITLNGNKGEGDGKGQHVLINGSGEVVGGAGGKLTGKKLERVSSKSGNVEKKAEQPQEQPQDKPQDLPQEQPKQENQLNEKQQSAVNFAHRNLEAAMKSPLFADKANINIRELESGAHRWQEWMQSEGVPKDVIEAESQKLIDKLNAYVSEKQVEGITNNKELMQRMEDDLFWAGRYGDTHGESDRGWVLQLQEMGLNEQQAKDVVAKAKEKSMSPETMERQAKDLIYQWQRTAEKTAYDARQEILTGTFTSDLATVESRVQESRNHLADGLRKIGYSEDQINAATKDLGAEQLEMFKQDYESKKSIISKAQARMTKKLEAVERNKERLERVANNFVPYTPQNDVASAVKFAIDNGYVLNADFGNTHIETVNAQFESLSNHIKKFPKLAAMQINAGSIQQRLKRMHQDMLERDLPEMIDRYRRWHPEWTNEQVEARAKKALGNPKRAPKRAYAYSSTAGSLGGAEFSGVFVAEQYGKDPIAFKENLERDVKSKWHPIGCNTIKSVMDHEYGHQIDHMLGIRHMPEINEIRKQAIQEGLSDLLTEHEKALGTAQYQGNNAEMAIGRVLSRYATENMAEFIAEAWAEYNNNPEPRATAKAVGALIEKAYKQKFG